MNVPIFIPLGVPTPCYCGATLWPVAGAETGDTSTLHIIGDRGATCSESGESSSSLARLGIIHQHHSENIMDVSPIMGSSTLYWDCSIQWKDGLLGVGILLCKWKDSLYSINLSPVNCIVCTTYNTWVVLIFSVIWVSLFWTQELHNDL